MQQNQNEDRPEIGPTAESGDALEANTPPVSLPELQAELDRLQAQLKRVNAESAERRLKIKELEELEQSRSEASMSATERLTTTQQRALELERQLLSEKETSTRLQEVVESQLATLKKDLPAHILDLLNTQDAAAQLDYLSKHQTMLARPTPSNIDASASGRGRPQRISDEDLMESKRLHRHYSF